MIVNRVTRMAMRVFRRAAVLLYHRVACVPSDPQLLCVAPEHFDEHLQVLCRQYQPISLARLAEHLLGLRRIPKRAVVLTFDDGYADNLHTVKPLLERYGIPATVFVVSGYVGEEKELFQETLNRVLLLSPRVPSSLVLDIAGVRHTWEVPERAQARGAIYSELKSLLTDKPDHVRRALAEDLIQWVGLDATPLPEYRMLDEHELSLLGAQELVEIGAHTVTHPLLSSLHPDRQLEEIRGSRDQLESILGRGVTKFSYPFGYHGDYDDASIRAVQRAGYELACSNFAGLVHRWTDRWQVPRWIVRDWDGDRFEGEMRRAFAS